MISGPGQVACQGTLGSSNQGGPPQAGLPGPSETPILPSNYVKVEREALSQQGIPVGC